MTIRTSLALLSLVISFGSGTAIAANKTFASTGTITYGGTLAAPGSKIKGTFSYDPSIAPGGTLPGFAQYWIRLLNLYFDCLNHYGCERDNLHEFLATQFTRHRAKNTGTDGL